MTEFSELKGCKAVVDNKKHQPNVFHRYKAIHDTVMEKFRKDGFVRSDDLAFEPPAGGYIRLRGTIECAAWIYVTVNKHLRVRKGSGPSARVQTESYSYNVVLEGEGNVVRYDGPHDHRPYHHVHRFDVFGADTVGTVTQVQGDEFPTLGEVLQEARTWMESNIDEITRRRLGQS